MIRTKVNFLLKRAIRFHTKKEKEKKGMDIFSFCLSLEKSSKNPRGYVLKASTGHFSKYAYVIITTGGHLFRLFTLDVCLSSSATQIVCKYVYFWLTIVNRRPGKRTLKIFLRLVSVSGDILSFQTLFVVEILLNVLYSKHTNSIHGSLLKCFTIGCQLR